MTEGNSLHSSPNQVTKESRSLPFDHPSSLPPRPKAMYPSGRIKSASASHPSGHFATTVSTRGDHRAAVAWRSDRSAKSSKTARLA